MHLHMTTKEQLLHVSNFLGYQLENSNGRFFNRNMVIHLIYKACNFLPKIINK